MYFTRTTEHCVVLTILDLITARGTEVQSLLNDERERKAAARAAVTDKVVHTGFVQGHVDEACIFALLQDIHRLFLGNGSPDAAVKHIPGGIVHLNTCLQGHIAVPLNDPADAICHREMFCILYNGADTLAV